MHLLDDHFTFVQTWNDRRADFKPDGSADWARSLQIYLRVDGSG